MQMIPAVPYRTRSNAELKVFKHLEVALPNSGFTAYHSLNLPHHPYKRFGEIDFLLCGPQGLFVLEVKGGLVECDSERFWHFTDRYGEESIKREGPFRQAESALHGFYQNLIRHFSVSQIERVPIGFGVLLPDCDLQASAEWDRNTYANQADMSNFEQWLEKFIRYWRKKHFKTRASASIDESALKDVKSFIRPQFEAIVPLYIQVSKAEEQICRLTQGQIELIDTVVDNPRILCSGGAGTGKTFLAMELARRWTAQGNEILLACHSQWLKCYIESRFDISHLTVSTIESLPVAAKRAGINKYEAVIVDEGQDLFNWKDLETLEAYLKGGLNAGRWCIFYDLNNQSKLFSEIDDEAFELLEQAHPARIRLNRNVRNTKNILKKIKDRLGADMGIESVGAGPEVREFYAHKNEESVSILVAEIERVIAKGGLTANQLTILSPNPWSRSTCGLLPSKVAKSIAVLDEFSVRQFPPNELSFGEISAFKGLENKAIIVIDLPEPCPEEINKALHYVGMSRARAFLSVIYRKF